MFHPGHPLPPPHSYFGGCLGSLTHSSSKPGAGAGLLLNFLLPSRGRAHSGCRCDAEVSVISQPGRPEGPVPAALCSRGTWVLRDKLAHCPRGCSTQRVTQGSRRGAARSRGASPWPRSQAQAVPRPGSRPLQAERPREQHARYLSAVGCPFHRGPLPLKSFSWSPNSL